MGTVQNRHLDGHIYSACTTTQYVTKDQCSQLQLQNLCFATVVEKKVCFSFVLQEQIELGDLQEQIEFRFLQEQIEFRFLQEQIELSFLQE